MKFIPVVILLIFIIGCDDEYKIENPENHLGLSNSNYTYRLLGGTGEDRARAMVKTSDGGFALLGSTNSTEIQSNPIGAPSHDYWLMKFDPSGNLQWQKTYGGSGDDRGQSLLQTSDNGFLLVGYAESADGDGSVNKGFHDNWIIKTDASGNIEWERSFGFSGHDHAYDVTETLDGNYVFVGFLDVSASNGAGATSRFNPLSAHGVGEFWVTKIDPMGNILWRKYFGGSNNDRAFGVENTVDGGLMIAGTSESVDFDIATAQGSYDFWVIRLDKNGRLLWEKSYGGTGIDQAKTIAADQNGGFFIAGNTFSTDGNVSYNNGAADAWVVAINENGDIKWEKSYGGSNFEDIQSITSLGKESILLTGNSKSADGWVSNNAGENDLWVFQINEKGDLIWEKSFGSTGLDFGFDALKISDKKLLLLGETESQFFEKTPVSGLSDIILIEMDL